MYKNIAIVLLACCCIFLVVNQRMERGEWENRSVGAPVYGGLIALRDVLPPDEYRNVVVPALQQAAAEGRMTYRQLAELDDKLKNLGQQAFDAAQQARPQEALAKAWENTKQGASQLGGEVGRNMRDALDELARMLEEATRREPQPAPSAPTPTPQPVDPMAPAQI